MKELIQSWFHCWQSGDFRSIPVSDDFTHTSPFGTIEGKDKYLSIVEANLDAFLGHEFMLHDELYEADRACVRYTSTKDGNKMEVSEWFFLNGDKIGRIVSYYNVGEPDPSLNSPD